MQDVLIVAIVFAVPISAIVSWAKIKMKRLELEAGVGGNRQLEDKMRQLERENADLQQRVGVLESIVTMDAPAPRTRVRVEATTAAAADDDERADAPAAKRAAR